MLQFIYKSHARLLSRLMDLILTVTSGKWKMGISLAVHVEGAIDSCMKCIVPLPASYKELKVIYSLLHVYPLYRVLQQTFLHYFINK